MPSFMRWFVPPDNPIKDRPQHSYHYWSGKPTDIFHGALDMNLIGQSIAWNGITVYHSSSSPFGVTTRDCWCWNIMTLELVKSSGVSLGGAPVFWAQMSCFPLKCACDGDLILYPTASPNPAYAPRLVYNRYLMIQETGINSWVLGSEDGGAAVFIKMHKTATARDCDSYVNSFITTYTASLVVYQYNPNPVCSTPCIAENNRIESQPSGVWTPGTDIFSLILGGNADYQRLEATGEGPEGAGSTWKWSQTNWAC